MRALIQNKPVLAEKLFELLDEVRACVTNDMLPIFRRDACPDISGRTDIMPTGNGALTIHTACNNQFVAEILPTPFIISDQVR